MRVPYVPYVEALHRWQRRLNRVTELDEDPFDSAVNLEDIAKAARDGTGRGPGLALSRRTLAIASAAVPIGPPPEQIMGQARWRLAGETGGR